MTDEEKKMWLDNVFNYPTPEQKTQMDAHYYSKLPRPKKNFSGDGLRFDLAHLKEAGLNIILLPGFYMAEYVDIIAKKQIDTNMPDWVEDKKKSVPEVSEDMYSKFNATSLGNLAYACMYCQNEELRAICRKKLMEVFEWYLNLTAK